MTIEPIAPKPRQWLSRVEALPGFVRCRSRRATFCEVDRRLKQITASGGASSPSVVGRATCDLPTPAARSELGKVKAQTTLRYAHDGE